MNLNQVVYVIGGLLLFSCTANPKKLGTYWQQANFDHAFSESPDSEILIHYTGCGGLIIEHKGEQILCDPFFSNIGFGKIAAKTLFCGYIKPNPEDILYGIKRSSADLNRASGVFITHSHYDHLLDVPWLFNNRFDTSRVSIYGGNTTAYILNSFGIQNKNLVNVQGNMAGPDRNGKWFDVAPGIKVMAIESHHAPHFAGFKLYSGENTGKFRHCSNDPEKSKLNNWKEGQTFSWLFELKDGNKKFHLLVVPSACEQPLGLPTDSLLDELGVDLAVMGTASYHGAEGYPHYQIEKMKPKAILFVHWEDFFRDYQKPLRMVRGTKVKKFPGIVRDKYEGPFWMPSPGVTMKVRY